MTPTPRRQRGTLRTAVVLLGAALLLSAHPQERGPVVALLDSGVDRDHPSLEGRLLEGRDLVDRDAAPEDANGHGTAMAGVIAGPEGVCSRCLVLPLRVTGALPSARPEELARGIAYAVEFGADAIVTGLAAPAAHPAVDSALALAEDEGIPVVAPAGNGLYTQAWHPAGRPSVLSVVAAGRGGDLFYSTNASGFEDVAAPGERLPTAARGGGSRTFTGSSAAAAYAAGVVGRILEVDPALASAGVRRLLRASTTELEREGFYATFDLGLLDLERALTRAQRGAYRSARVRDARVVPRRPAPGQPVRALVTVANTGTVPLADVALEVGWTAPGARSVGVPRLQAGASTTLEVEVGPVAEPGGRSLSYALVGPEWDEEPARGEVAVEVVEREDPAIRVRIGPPSVPAGGTRLDRASYPFTVRNDGNVTLRGVRIDVLANGEPVSSERLDSLPVGGRVAREAVWREGDAEVGRDLSLQVRAEAESPGDGSASDTWFHTLWVGERPRGLALQYAKPDFASPWVISDAPWMTIRGYVPVLFFAPQTAPGSPLPGRTTLDWLEVRQYDPAASTGGWFGGPLGDVILHDDCDPSAGADRFPSGAEIIGPLGLGLADYRGQPLRDFWHEVVRLPLDAIDRTGDHHYLRTRVEVRVGRWQPPRCDGGGDDTVRFERVLRVRAGDSLPSFHPADRYYDAHVHTIAEQTDRTQFDVLAPFKNYGGPIVMLAEASYALGFVDQRPGGGDFSAYRDRLVVTDHNVFYSDEPHDAGTAPERGPTRFLDGGERERNWYRSRLGALAGEEVALESVDQTLPLGHHFLAYDTRHVEGPWHGGLLFEPNPNHMVLVLEEMKEENQTGFGYAAHPSHPMFRWPKKYFDEALGVPGTSFQGEPNNSRDGPHVHRGRDDFVFRGSQVWNAKLDMTGVERFDHEELRHLDPFAPGPRDRPERFRPDDDWERALEASVDAYLGRVQEGLDYYFAEDPTTRFIRKTYMAAGTDAHGDFNYAEDVLSTHLERLGDRSSVSSNAYGRVRTYVLAHDRVGPSAGEGRAHAAYRGGNSVLTDGPVCALWLDSSGRHDPGGEPRWHDADERFENEEGRIGGSGTLDGARTLLAPNPRNNRVFARTRWLPSITPGADPVDEFQVTRVLRSTVLDPHPLSAGPPGPAVDRPFGEAFRRPEGTQAVLLEGLSATELPVAWPDEDAGSTERCLTNPIWVIPVEITLEHPGVCPVPRRGLRATFRFSKTMGGASGVFVRPLDGQGDSAGPRTELVADPGWEEDAGRRNARFGATNEDPVACPPAPWNAVDHVPSQDTLSYVVYMAGPRDAHGNALNDVGDTFVVRAGEKRRPREEH